MLQLSANNGNLSPDEIVVITWDTGIRYWPRANKQNSYSLAWFMHIVSDFGKRDHHSDCIMRSFITRTLCQVQLEYEMDRACSKNGAKRNAYRVLVGKARRRETTRKTKP
jgi:hypothetical protein